MISKMYRYEDVLCGDETHAYVQVRLRVFEVVKRTPCGVKIAMGYGGEKFINLNARKQYASVSVEEAKISFIARKRRQAGILSSQLVNVNEALRIVESGEIASTKRRVHHLTLDRTVN